MKNLEEALRRIEAFSRRTVANFGTRGFYRLNLDGLQLTASDVDKLIPYLKRLPNLMELGLNHNHLDTLPESVGQLPNLRVLDLHNNYIKSLPKQIGDMTNLGILDLELNQLVTIPREFGRLKNLQQLELSENRIEVLPQGMEGMQRLKMLTLKRNRIQHLPAGIGRMMHLEYLDASSNRLRTLPMELGELPNISHLDLQSNPLSGTSMQWLRTVFSAGVYQVDMSAHEQDTGYSKALELLYGASADEKLSKINGLGGSYQTGNGAAMIPGHAVVKEFLKRVPLNNDGDQQLYIPPLTYFMDKVLLEKSEMGLLAMASSLGNCATPVKDLLTQKAVGLILEQKGALSNADRALVERAAIEEHIWSEIGPTLKNKDLIEQVQGLLNSLFVDGSEDMSQNKVKIKGERPRVVSKTRFIGSAFEDVSTEVGLNFARLCCITDTQGNPAVDDQGKYTLDPAKYKAITKPYLGKRGVVSNDDIEKYLQQYKEKMQDATAAHKALFLYHNEDSEVISLVDSKGHMAQLSQALYNGSTTKDLQEITDDYIGKQLSKFRELGDKYLRGQRSVAQDEIIGLTVVQVPAKMTARSISRISSKSSLASDGSSTPLKKKNERRHSL